jgi:signal transduction histidine kinase
LLSNAIKFTPYAGFITVDLNVRERKSNHWLDIKVTDSGVGIDDILLNAILTGDAASQEGTDGEQGYGLGFKLIKELVADKKKTLHVTSEKEKGICFWSLCQSFKIKRPAF